MRSFALVLAAALLSGCGVFTSGSRAPGELPAGREALWRTGHEAMRADSFRVAMAAFQRLATDHPHTGEGREARFFLGALYLDPANTAFDAGLAAQNLEMYVAQDTLKGRAARRPEAAVLLAMARELGKACAERAGGPLKCDTEIRTVRAPGEPAPSGGGDNGAAAEAARLRRELAERDATIRQLREELQRIRNTLAPRPD
ncbi:MAG TPA: hypothetical protein VFQ45_02250 [Longimicrobium sp.]|nr:hypothetical protein [Longimicrobium sp.]